MRLTPALPLLLLAVPVCALAQAPAMGPDISVNTSLLVDAPDVAVDANGNFVVVWESDYGQDVRARLFDAHGLPYGDPFVVSPNTGVQPRVAMSPTGEFAVTWAGFSTGTSGEVMARIYDGTGTPLGGEFQVNVYTTGYQQHAAVAMDDGSNFVVVWWSGPGPGVPNDQDGDNGGIFARRFDSAGTPLSGDVQVNTYTTGDQNLPDVAMKGDGSFVVVWESWGQDGDVEGVFGQRFDASGSPTGSEFPVNTSTTGFQTQPRVARGPGGDFVVAWAGYPQDVFARHFDDAGAPMGAEFVVSRNTTNDSFSPAIAMSQDGGYCIAWMSSAIPTQVEGRAQRFSAANRPIGAEFQINQQAASIVSVGGIRFDPRNQLVVTWGADGNVRARRGGFPGAHDLAVDARASGGTSNLNGVLEAGERVTVDPAWENASTAAFPLSGAASNISGPSGPTYSIDDASAGYGSIPAGTTVDCYDATGDCLEVSVSGSRPAPHWDVTFDEALSSGVTKTWTLHVGESFPDVPVTHPFYGFVENIFHNGITGGCGAGDYCPGNAVTRAQMAVFILKAEHGSTYVPPPCAGMFPDVTCPSPFADWIEQLAAEGITGGCGSGNYCPDNPVTRAQMAVFLLKAEHGADYTPPVCQGAFGDVICPSLFADWIERLADEGITGGCGNNNYCPDNPNTRGQMAVFLVKTFELELYGP